MGCPAGLTRPEKVDVRTVALGGMESSVMTDEDG